MERVYVSDIKKLVSWYQILVKFAPEVLKAAVVEAPEPVAEEKAEKPKAKKAASKKASV